MAGETPAHHHQDPQTPRPINLPGRLRSAQKDPPHGSQRGHLLVAACHRRPTAPVHLPARISTAQELLKESCTVPAMTRPHDAFWPAFTSPPLSSGSIEDTP